MLVLQGFNFVDLFNIQQGWIVSLGHETAIPYELELNFCIKVQV